MSEEKQRNIIADAKTAARLVWPWTENAQFGVVKVSGKTLKSGIRRLTLTVDVRVPGRETPC